MAKTQEAQVKNLQMRLERNRKLMWKAVDQERYEAAAVLRDRIRDLQKKLVGTLQEPMVRL